MNYRSYVVHRFEEFKVGEDLNQVILKYTSFKHFFSCFYVQVPPHVLLSDFTYF